MSGSYMQTSGQDGGIRRYTLPPHTTKGRTTTNLKTKSNQNCQKIELYGSPTTKELKKKYSFRLEEGQRQAARAEKTCDKAATGWSHIWVLITGRNNWGSKTQVSSTGKASLETSGCKNTWVLQ